MKENILEGLKFAISKGDSLQEAMQSFYNAGYSREDIEYAARELQDQFRTEQIKGIHAVGPYNANPKAEEEYPPDIKGSAGQSESEPVSKDLQIQKVSDYGSAENPKKKMIILIVVLLVILAVVLAGIFFFRSSLISLFNKFWG